MLEHFVIFYTASPKLPLQTIFFSKPKDAPERLAIQIASNCNNHTTLTF